MDYTSPESMSKTLTKNAVHTIVSCLDVNTEDCHNAQMSLIRASELSSTVKRFTPSEFAVDYLSGRSAFPSAKFKVQAVELLKTTHLEYTRFISGTFMDYFGPPGAPTELKMIHLVLDHKNHTAVIPGDGNVPVVVTHTTDLAKFIAAALDLEHWNDPSIVIGDKLTLNEMVKFAEEAHKTKFAVTHDSMEDVKAGRLTELQANQQLYQYVPERIITFVRRAAGLAMAEGLTNLDTSGGTLNEKFPDIKTMSVKELFADYV